MGCSNGTQAGAQTTLFDQRLPFSRSEVRDIQAFWGLVKRRFEESARENLIRFFRDHPYFQVLYPCLSDLQNEQDMRYCLAFEVQATAIFNVFDYVIENMDRDLDGVFLKLEETARLHAKIEHFCSDFFRYMEEPFIQALKEKLFEHFKEPEELLMRKLFGWVQSQMALEVAAIECHLIPGD